MKLREAMGLLGAAAAILAPSFVLLTIDRDVATLRSFVMVPLVVVAPERGAITDEEVLTMAHEEAGAIRVMAVELISFRGLGSKAWGYSSSPRRAPTEWWNYQDALDEGGAVAEENEWQQLWLIEALVTEDGNAYPTGVRERVR